MSRVYRKNMIRFLSPSKVATKIADNWGKVVDKSLLIQTRVTHTFCTDGCLASHWQIRNRYLCILYLKNIFLHTSTIQSLIIVAKAANTGQTGPSPGASGAASTLDAAECERCDNQDNEDNLICLQEYSPKFNDTGHGTNWVCTRVSQKKQW